MSANRDNLTSPENPVLAGRITIVYGIKGWVKVFSYTEPVSNILQYQPWWLRQGDAWQRLSTVNPKLLEGIRLKLRCRSRAMQRISGADPEHG